MSKEPNYLKLAKQFDQINLIKLFDELTTEEVKKQFHNIYYCVNLTEQRPSQKSGSKKIFLEEIQAYFLRRGIESNIFENINIFEYLYKSILELRADFLSKSNGFEAFQYLLGRIVLEHQRLISHVEHLESVSQEIFFAEEQSQLKSMFFSGFDLDVNVEEIVKIFQMNCIIFSYENHWFDKDGTMVLPIELITTIIDESKSDNFIEYSEKLALNSGLWDLVEDSDFRFRFFENETKITNKEIVSNNEVKRRLSDYAIISKKRLERIFVINAVNFAPMRREYSHIFSEDKIEYILNNININQLYCIDIEEHKNEYNGLTIKEWLKSLIILKNISNKYHFNPISYLIFSKFLDEGGVPKNKHNIIFRHFLFGRISEDLYDNPIIKFSNNEFIIFPVAMLAPNFIAIINSILSQSENSIKGKGENFEIEALNFLKEKSSNINFNVSNPSKSFKGSQYQYDIVLEWDDYIFIFECKNRSIPNTTPMSLKNFDEKSGEYVDQVLRLKDGLVKNHRELNVDIKNKTIIPVILNSLPFALDYAIQGVYFIDYSSLTSFFKKKNLDAVTYDPKTNQEFRSGMHSNWAGDAPEVGDFLRYLHAPFQVEELKNRITSFTTSHTINEYTIIVERDHIDMSRKV